MASLSGLIDEKKHRKLIRTLDEVPMRSMKNLKPSSTTMKGEYDKMCEMSGIPPQLSGT